jgi:hypothetical protein
MTVHKVDLTGDYETTVYDAARRLLAECADPGDRVETRRNGILSMSGVIGELAKLQVVFAATGPRLVRYKGCISGSLAAKTAQPVDPGLPAHESAPDGGFPA